MDHLGSAFTGDPVPKGDLLVEAQRARTRLEVLDLPSACPDRRFYRPHDLWAELSEVPR